MVMNTCSLPGATRSRVLFRKSGLYATRSMRCEEGGG